MPEIVNDIQLCGNGIKVETRNNATDKENGLAKPQKLVNGQYVFC